MAGPTTRDYLSLALLSVVWGSSYILIKVGLTVFTPYQVAGMRLGFSALALLPWAATHLRRTERRQIPLLIVVGLAGTGLPSFLFPLAQTELSSSLTGMLSGLTPLCTFLLAYLFFARREAGGRQLLGVVLGLGGALILAGAAPGEAAATTRFAYAGFILLACFCYALSSNLVGAYLGGLSSVTITVTSFFLVGLPALIWAASAGAVYGTVRAAEGSAGWWALAAVATLAVVSTVLASLLFFRLVQRTGAVFASTVSYVIPVVALGWGLADGEGVSVWQLPAVGLILVGVFLSRRKAASTAG